MANISIETKKFTQLPTTQSLTDSSLMLARDVAGVKTIQFSDLRAQLQGQTYVQDLKSKNIFYATIEQGAVTSNGGEQSKADVIRSQYNSVSASTTYAISWTNAFWMSAYYFDSSKTIISYEFVLDPEGTSASFTTPATCSYVRFNFGKSNGSDITPSNISNIQLELGDTATSYVPFSLDTVGLTNRRFVQDWESKNIIDMLSLGQGEIDASTGDVYASTTRLRSGYCSVEDNTDYTLSFSPNTITIIRVFCYNSAKEYLSAIYKATASGCTFTTPSNCAYVRFNFFKGTGSETIVPSDITNLQLEQGTSSSTYVPYAIDNVELTRFKQNKLGVTRVQFERTINANSDTAFSPSDILTQAGLPNAKALIIIPEGTRPKDSWTEVHPVMFYLATSGTWGVHNYGTGGVAIVDFILVYDSYLYS